MSSFKSAFKSYDWKQYFPAFAWFPEYSQNLVSNLRGDFLAALTVACLAIPQAMSYAVLAGVPPINGLYTCSASLIAYSLLATSRLQVSGPAALDSMLTYSAIGTMLTLKTADPSEVILAAQALAVTVGLIQVGLGFLKMGILANFLSYPVLTGFINGAAITIIISQIQHILGIPGVPKYTGTSSSILELIYDLKHLDESYGYTVLIASFCLVFLEIAKYWKQNRYNAKTAGTVQKILKLVADLATLIVTVISAIVAKGYALNGVVVHSNRDKAFFKTYTGKYVNVIGNIPSGIPTLEWPDLSRFDAELSNLLVGSVLIAIVSFLENYSIASMYSEKFGYPINASQELIAIGSSNIISGVFQGHPVGGPLSRSALSISAGARSLISNAMVGAIVLIVISFLSSIFYYVPLAALGAAIISAISGSFKLSQFTEIWKLGLKADFFTMVITALCTVFVGVIHGIGIGAGLSILFALRRSAFPKVRTLGRLPESSAFRDVQNFPEAETFPGVQVIRFDADLYFANSALFRDKMLEAMSSKIVILDASVITAIDTQGLKTLKSVLSAYKSQNVTLIVASVRFPVMQLLKAAKLDVAIGSENFVHDVAAGLNRGACFVSDDPCGEFETVQPVRASVIAATPRRYGAPSPFTEVPTSGEGTTIKRRPELQVDEKKLEFDIEAAMNAEHHPLDFGTAGLLDLGVNAVTAVAPISDSPTDAKAV